MKYIVLKAKAIEDNSLIPEEMPVIVTEHGVLEPLVDYFLEYDGIQDATRRKTVQAVTLLLDFMSANVGNFDEPEEMFKVFVKRLKTGTISADGTDPSGLYWEKKSPNTVGPLVARLNEFSDFMADKLKAKPINPFREATAHEEQLNWAAYQHKKARSFLAHTWSNEKGKRQNSQVRTTGAGRAPSSTLTATKNFPKDRIFDLLFRGFRRRGVRDGAPIYERWDLRGMLITILMHGAGHRVSEPFHLYVSDVIEDPFKPGSALVRIYHPSEGAAPPDLFDQYGNPIRCTREEYLLKKYGLKPRNKYGKTDKRHASWKNPLLNDEGQKFMHSFWFPSIWGRIFWLLWGHYLQQLALIERNHPFAFVNLWDGVVGDMYSMQSFSKETREGKEEKGAHAKAVKRIGLTPAKALGTTAHGHRHRYGWWLDHAGPGNNPTEIAKIKQYALHHKSVESQKVYGLPTVDEVTKAMTVADTRLIAGGKTPVLPDMTTYGFEDVDPLGLFSGPHPKLIGGR
jgi:hypothetical protein